jgi:hypothetical protein
MEHKNELLPLAFKQAKGIKDKILELAITASMDTNLKDELVIKLAKAKAVESGKPYTSHLSGMEWYVDSLVEKSQLTDKELLQTQYDELLPSNSSFDELVGML